MDIELKPCPFCGKKPRFVHQRFMTDGETHYMVSCYYKGCDIMPQSTFKFLSKEDAAKAWNRRADNG